MPTITIDLPGGAMTAYTAEPATKRGGTVVLIQEIFGVNATMRAACAMVADLGFSAICPDLFWRLEPNLEMDATQMPKALGLMQRFDQERGVADLIATIAHARAQPGSNGRVGTMGFCLGGRMAMKLAMHGATDVDISYYGTGIDSLLDGIASIRTPLLLHIAGDDALSNPDARGKIVAAVASNPHVHAWVYPGAGHAFARPGGDHYDGLYATIANGRSAEALAAALIT